MRDPKRIPALTKRLARAWGRLPDIRLGQLLVAAGGGFDYLLSVEDEELIKAVETLEKDLHGG